MALRGPKTGAGKRPQFWARENTNEPRNSSPAYLQHDLCCVSHGPKIGAGKRPQNRGRILVKIRRKEMQKNNFQIRTLAFTKLHFAAKAEQPESKMPLQCKAASAQEKPTSRCSHVKELKKNNKRSMRARGGMPQHRLLRKGRNAR
jgi:hypothetical protein